MISVPLNLGAGERVPLMEEEESSGEPFVMLVAGPWHTRRARIVGRLTLRERSAFGVPFPDEHLKSLVGFADFGWVGVVVADMIFILRVRSSGVGVIELFVPVDATPLWHQIEEVPGSFDGTNTARIPFPTGGRSTYSCPTRGASNGGAEKVKWIPLVRNKIQATTASAPWSRLRAVRPTAEH